MDAQKTLPFPQTTYTTKITFAILLLLLVWRMVFLQGEMSYQHEIIHLCTAYGLISLVIWLNRNDLQGLNLDKYFIIGFIIIGCLYSLMIPLASGIFLGIVTLINVWALSSNKFCFESAPTHNKQAIIFILIMQTPLFLKLWLLGNSITWPNDRTVYEAIFRVNPPFVVFEEVVFRSLLWAFLARANLKGYQIILIQAILFWLSHLKYYTSDPASFWVWIPFISIILGVIVWRSKSITPSIIGHYLYNLLLTLIR